MENRLFMIGAMENRIAERREGLNLSQRELAKLAGTSGQMIGMLERGERKLTVDWLRRLSNALGCSPGDLVPGMAASIPAPEAPIFGDMPRDVPVLGSVDSGIPEGVVINEIDVRGGMGGGGIAAREHNHVDEYGNCTACDDVKATWALPQDYVRHELRVLPAKVYLIEVKGDSMTPTLESGDRVMVDTADSVPSPGGVFALWDGLGVVVKRLEHVPMSEPPTVRIISDNPHHGAYERTLDEVRVIGRVVWFGRRM
jgi:SOS-response transcriptional repressor LexA